MFRQLALALVRLNPGLDGITAVNRVLTNWRPSQLAEFLEEYWRVARTPARYFGELANPAHIDMALDDRIDAGRPPVPGPPPPEPPSWHHIVYAYMLENTRITDIFRRVVYEYAHGDRLPPPTQATQRWLHATEQLFFADPLPYSVRAVTSRLRPDSAAVRRNAYYRMLGMDLNHGADDGRPYAYVKAEAANRDFPALFESLLTEVWRGYTNRFTFVAENLTDDDAINTLVRRIREMLQTRRQTGTLSREEFDAVATLSWFHLTVELNTVVVEDLGADAGGTADRLKKIGERVGLPAHARSDAYFQLAPEMSAVLIAIENGDVETAGADSLYAGDYRDAMLRIITHWSIATGRNVKDPTLRQPLTAVLGAGSGSTVGGGNGAGAVNRLASVLR